MSIVYGIIPAAGRSRRMGRPKPALPIGGRPMLHCAVEALLAASPEAVVIVVSEAGRGMAEPLAARCEIIVNPHPDAEMIESIQLAIRHIEVTRPHRDGGGYLVCPADVADISPETMRTCTAAFQRDPARIVIATHNGKRGHPIIFPQRLAGEVLSLAPTEGLNLLPRRHPADLLEVPCDDPAVVRNVNTPADYNRLAR